MVKQASATHDGTIRLHGGWHVTLWALQILGAASFGLAGYEKLAGTPSQITVFTTIGLGQWFRLLIGTLETLGALALLIPRLRALGALGLVGVLIGALVTCFAVGASPLSALVNFVIVGLVAWGRRGELTPSWVLGSHDR